MTSAAKALPAVLDRIDADLDKSLDRLFELVRIPSISTDSAYKDFCRRRRQSCGERPDEPRLRGRCAPDRGPSGRDGQEQRRDCGEWRPARAVLRPLRCAAGRSARTCGTRRRSSRKIDTLPDGRKIIHGRGACDDKGQFMTFVEALRAYKAVTGKLPLDVTMMIEGEEECGSKSLFDFVRTNANEFKRDLALVCDTGMWNTNDAAGDDIAARAALRRGDDHLRGPRPALRHFRWRRREPDPHPRQDHRVAA